MSRTHRKHESYSRLKARGPKNSDVDKAARLKSHKQRRSTERTRLRREFL